MRRLSTMSWQTRRLAEGWLSKFLHGQNGKSILLGEAMQIKRSNTEPRNLQRGRQPTAGTLGDHGAR